MYIPAGTALRDRAGELPVSSDADERTRRIAQLSAQISPRLPLASCAITRSYRAAGSTTEGTGLLERACELLEMPIGHYRILRASARTRAELCETQRRGKRYENRFCSSLDKIESDGRHSGIALITKPERERERERERESEGHAAISRGDTPDAKYKYR